MLDIFFPDVDVDVDAFAFPFPFLGFPPCTVGD